MTHIHEHVPKYVLYFAGFGLGERLSLDLKFYIHVRNANIKNLREAGN